MNYRLFQLCRLFSFDLIHDFNTKYSTIETSKNKFSIKWLTIIDNMLVMINTKYKTDYSSV